MVISNTYGGAEDKAGRLLMERIALHDTLVLAANGTGCIGNAAYVC